jgi:hypothetical protein
LDQPEHCSGWSLFIEEDMIDVGIISAPRKVTYIGLSLDSYFSQWLTKPHVFQEPDCPNYLNKSRVVVHENKETLGCVLNWIQAAEWMLANTTSKFVMMCEDDILWLEGARNKIELVCRVLTGELVNPIVQQNLPLSDIGFISGYCAAPNAPSKKEKGWRQARYRSAGWCGALCLVFPRRSLERLLADKDRFIHFATWTPDSLRRVNKFTGPVFLDYAIGHIMFHCEKMKLMVHAPTLIQHMGMISTFESNNKPASLIHTSRQPYLG